MPSRRPQRRRTSRKRNKRSELQWQRPLLGMLLVVVCVLWIPPVRSALAAEWDALLHRREAREQASRYRIDPDLALAIAHAARSEGIDPELGFRLVRVESGFRERAVSPVGALGLTQLMPRTAAELQPGISREQTFDRDTNLRLGFRYLRWLLHIYDGDIEEALHAYNRGPGTVRRVRAAGRDPANGYAERILGPHGTVDRYQGQGFVSAIARF
jgi:soluble lytic murein transglycosylase-like protein